MVKIREDVVREVFTVVKIGQVVHKLCQRHLFTNVLQKKKQHLYSNEHF